MRVLKNLAAKISLITIVGGVIFGGGFFVAPQPTNAYYCSNVNCSRITYNLYIINPDGTRRYMSDGNAKITTLSNGQTRVSFENGRNSDYHDVLVDVTSNCPYYTFTLNTVDTSWNHQVGVRFLVDSLYVNDLSLWTDAKSSVGGIFSADVRDYREICTGTPANSNTNSSSSSSSSSTVDSSVLLGKEVISNLCSGVGYNIYLVDSAGKIYSMKTTAVKETTLSSDIYLFKYETTGDNKYDDFWLTVGYQGNNLFEVRAIGSASQSHYKVKAKIFKSNVSYKILTLWSDSVKAAGSARTLDFQALMPTCFTAGSSDQNNDKNKNVCTVNCDELKTELSIISSTNVTSTLSKIEAFGATTTIYNFEETGSTSGADYDDVVLTETKDGCEWITYTLLGVNSSLTHKVLLRLTYKGKVSNVVLWANDKAHIGESVEVDVVASSKACPAPVAPTPPAASACGNYITQNIKWGAANNQGEVKKLQTFLHDMVGYTNVGVTGTYDKVSFDAVIKFQEKYASEILVPQGIKKGTGYVYTATRKKINSLYCSSKK